MSQAAKPRAVEITPVQLETIKLAVQATAQITAAMVAVTAEKNPAKISEAFKTIYKAINETIKTTSV